jgi:hypothetical protein
VIGMIDYDVIEVADAAGERFIYDVTHCCCLPSLTESAAIAACFVSGAHLAL